MSTVDDRLVDPVSADDLIERVDRGLRGIRAEMSYQRAWLTGVLVALTVAVVSLGRRNG